MTKERIKTVLLVILVLSSLFLSGEIWFGEKLWPEGYDFFSVYKETFFGRMASWFRGNGETLSIKDTGALDSIFAPKTTMLSFDEGRLTFDSTDEDGKQVINKINEILKQSFVSSKVSSISESDWQEALIQNGIYADYSVPVSVKAMMDFLGCDNSAVAPFDSFDQMIIVIGDGTKTAIPVYFRNSETEVHSSVITSFSKENLLQFFGTYAARPMLNLAYSFELNLDKEVVGTGENHQKVILDSYILLPLEAVNMNSIRQDYINVSEHSEKILSAMGYNKNTVRKFTRTGTTLFVDSDSTLTLSRNYIEYEASSSEKGIEIGNDSTIATAAAGSASLIDKIISCFDINENTKLFISTPLTGEKQDEYTLHFDYLYDAVPVNIGEHGCVVTVKGGKVTHMKILIRSFSEAEILEDCFALDVLEKVYEKAGRDVKIEELVSGYEREGDIYRKIWNATVDNEVISVY